MSVKVITQTRNILQRRPGRPGPPGIRPNDSRTPVPRSLQVHTNPCNISDPPGFQAYPCSSSSLLEPHEASPNSPLPSSEGEVHVESLDSPLGLPGLPGALQWPSPPGGGAAGSQGGEVPATHSLRGAWHCQVGSERNTAENGYLLNTN